MSHLWLYFILMENTNEFNIFINRSTRRKNKREYARLMEYIFIGSTRIFFDQVRPHHYLYINATNDVRKLFQIVPIIFVPDDIIARIFHFLNDRDLLDCSQVSRSFNQIILQNPNLLKRKIEEKKRIYNIYYENCCETTYRLGYTRCYCVPEYYNEDDDPYW
jgi:hypothetical protein